MKKSLIIVMSAIILLTGCNKTKENVEKKEITKEVTTTENATTEVPTSVVVEASKEEVQPETKVAKTDSKTTNNAQTKASSTKGATVKKTTKANTTKKTTKNLVEVPVPATNPTTTEKVKTVAEVKAAMESLKSKYPDGTPWTNDNIYTWKGGIYSSGRGCAAFAFMLSDAAFGNRKAKKHTDFNNIKVGDIVRYLTDQHSVIVLEVKGDTFTVAEGNINSSILWGRKITRDEFKATGTYILTRW